MPKPTRWSRAGRVPMIPLVALVTAVLSGTAVTSRALAAGDEAGIAVAPWDTPFAPDTASLRKAADALAPPEGKAFEVLLREVSWTLDEGGRARIRDRSVVRLLTEAGVQGWGSIEQAWAPWYQQKPSMRARVIGKDGVAHELDPKTIAEGPAGDADDDVYSDRRIARAPLPTLSVGAIVEQEFEIVESSALLDAGAGHSLQGLGPDGVRHVRFTLSAPAALPLQYAVHGIPMEALRREESGGRVRLSYDGGPWKPSHEWEPGMPDEAKLAPLFSFSTGRSWHDIAARYAAIVDERIAAGKPDAILKEALGGASAKGAPDLAKLSTRLHAHVRYTGVEFGDAAIVPAPPTETWKRGYGDCKDKAVLLVALLRASGSRAYVALLQSGSGRDVDPALPAFSGFNHAIVVLEGVGKDGQERVWIDATDPNSRPGQLPESDQGRFALIAGDATRELVRIPKGDARANGVTETREFFLAEHGGSRLVVTREPRGTREAETRAQYHRREKKDIQSDAEEHASSYYLGKKVEKLEYPDPSDLSKPFSVRFEVPEAGRGQTDATESAVAILPEEWVLRLWAFRPPAEGDDEDPPARDEKKKDKKRKSDYVWTDPFTDEWRFRIVPPEGFVSAGLPESETRAIGPIALTQEYHLEKSGVVTATIRLSSGKERMTPAEFETARAEVKRLTDMKPFFVRFESVAGQHAAAGRIREALAEYRRLIALHPKEALHHQHMARALLQASLGEAARRQARLAVESEPKSAAAHETLAWILQHDLLGRRFGGGFDRAGAVAAYRKAIELDPKDKDGAANLAILLEHDATGRRYGNPADVREAIVEYQRLRKDLKVKGYDSNLAIAYLRSEQFAEAKRFTSELPAGPSRDAIYLAAVAASDGADAAIREASKMGDSAESRRAAIESAGRTLVVFRRYDAAARLLTEAAGRSEKPGELLTQAENLKRLRRYEEMPLPADDPATPLKKLFLAALLYGSPGAPSIRSIAAEGLLDQEENGEAKFVEGVKSGITRHGIGSEIPQAVMLDAVFPNMTITRDGSDAAGYRLSVDILGATGPLEVFVTKEKGDLRIAAFGLEPASLGVEALRRAEAGDLDGARQWLDWARARLTFGGGDDPLGGALLRRFWTKGAKDGVARVRIAAASLACNAPKIASKAAKVLGDAAVVRESGAAPEDVELAVCVCAESLKNWSDLQLKSAKLFAAHPASDTAFRLQNEALVRLGRLADSEKLAKERLAGNADDVVALQALVTTRLAREDYSGVQTASMEIIQKGRASDVDYNNLAWNGLFTKITDQTVEWAQKGAGQPGSRHSSGLHTLAAVYADLGRSVQARDALLESLRVKGAETPESYDWYVLGRIAENYGETETAREDYKKVEKPEVGESGGSTYRLAQKRLAALSAPPPGAPATPAAPSARRDSPGKR